MYTPSKGVQALSDINQRAVFSPGGVHANGFWPLGRNGLPSQHQQKLQAEPWRQQGFAQGTPGSALMAGNGWQPMMPAPGVGMSGFGSGLGGMSSSQQLLQLQQQQMAAAAEIARLRQENAELKQQQQQQQQGEHSAAAAAAGAAAAATPSLLNPGVDPTQALLQPTITALPGLQQPAGANPGLTLAAVKYVAHEAAVAAAHQTFQKIVQHEGGMLVQQQAGQGAAAAGVVAAAVSAAAAAAGLGAPTVSAAAAAAAGAADVPKEQTKGVKAWGKQTSFAAFWGWWQSAPPGFSFSRAALGANKEAPWLQGDKKQRVCELNQFLKVIQAKKDALEKQLGGVTATDEQAVAALDLEMQQQGLKNLAAYHKKHIKSPYAGASRNTATPTGTAAGAGAVGKGEAAAAAAGQGAAAGASPAPAAADRVAGDAVAGTAAARRGAKRGRGEQTSNSRKKGKR
jgi:hypothetical protein